MHQDNYYLTLTYAPEHLPMHGTLKHKDFQSFMKRYRKKYVRYAYNLAKGKTEAVNPIRYYMCGEYGETTFRPHYHAAIFGHAFTDLEYLGKSASGSPMWRSPQFGDLWPLGHHTIQQLTFSSAAYIARYIMKKITGPEAPEYYTRHDPITDQWVEVEPEYNRMSTNPGIGKSWFDEFHQTDAYSKDHLVHDGRKLPIPRYYDKLLGKENEKALRKVKQSRKAKAAERSADNTWERLATREKLAEIKLKKLERSL